MHFNFLTHFRKQLKNSGSSKFKIFPANHLLDTFLNCLLSFIIVIVRVLWECFEFVITNEVSEVSLIVAIFCVFVLDQNCVCNLSKWGCTWNHGVLCKLINVGFDLWLHMHGHYTAGKMQIYNVPRHPWLTFC